MKRGLGGGRYTKRDLNIRTREDDDEDCEAVSSRQRAEFSNQVMNAAGNSFQFLVVGFGVRLHRQFYSSLLPEFVGSIK